MHSIDKRLQQQVMQLLSKDDKDYNQFMYDCGLAYLNEIAPAYPQVTAEIIRSNTFWDWWKGHWAVREMEFIEIIDESPAEAIIDVMQMYKDLHDPKTLAAALYLNGQVLQQSYATLISKITKEQKPESVTA